jgi:hypothetical protein
VPSSTALCVHPQEAPGFFAAPSVATHNTITKRTTKVKFQVAQIGRQGRALNKGGIASKGSHMVWSQQGGDPKIKT